LTLLTLGGTVSPETRILSADDFIDHVQQFGIAAAEISRQEKQQLQQQWRAAFAFNLRTQMARRQSSDRDWRVFSTKQAVCREGAVAISLYSRVRVPDFFIVPEDEGLPGLRCTGDTPPDLSVLQLDLYVSPPDFTWTMVFTHEQPWHGPYFARREWQKIKL
jgi:hypothetical protein